MKWSRREFAAPSPHFIKQSCIVRNGTPNAVWIETGTFKGSTTRLLSAYATMVHSIEPEPTLFANADKFFSSFDNVEILNGLSEDIFPALLPKVEGDVNFWLDGHYSAGTTFQGPKDTPIVDELDCISRNILHFQKVTVLIDDIRCFNPHISEFSEYPSVDYLVDWSRENSLRWHIEHDIFVAKNH